MNVEAYRDLKALEVLSQNPTLTQRHLANRLEVALGLTNLMVQRLIKKGYVKAVNLKRNRIRYLVTPKGVGEKTRLTYEYLEYSLHLYRRVREVLKQSFSERLRPGATAVVFFGAGEIAEIAYLTLKELDLKLVAVADDQAAGQQFFGVPVVPLSEVPRLAFDWGVVSSLNGDLGALRQTLRELGVDEQKLIVIERDRAKIQAILPGLDLMGKR